MAVPVARVHLKVAHAALPALLPTPPKWRMLPMLQTPCPCVAAIVLPKPLSKPSRADTDGRWDARKTKPAASAAEPAASASSGSRRSSDSFRSSAGHGSPSLRKNTTSPPPKPGRADSVERWDTHKKAAASPALSSPSASRKWTSSRALSAERWDMHKKPCLPLPQAKLLDDGERSSTTGSNDMDTEEEEILWKPRAMYAGPGFVVAAPQSSLLPMPTAFLVPVA